MVGRTVSHYRVKEKLGGGAMGVVYRAVDTKLDRDVALKFLPREYSDDADAKERFVQEARAASRLDHPHIATVFEIAETDDGRLFIAMPFYDGETLKEHIARDPLTVSEAVQWGLQISRGLEAAHAAGIIHRDLKPANVMVADGRAKIVDFGLAKVAGADITGEGATLGTAAYMSPEQARREEVDARSDLWSLGVLLYEMLAGERPFRGAYPEAAIYAVLHETPRPLDELLPDVPEPIAQLVHDLLQRDPEDRISDAGTVVRRLEGAMDRQPRRSVDHSQPAGIALWSGITAGVALLVTLAVFAYGWPFSMSSSLRESAESSDSLDGSGNESVAVLPFEVSGSGAETWRDGMVTVLSTGLDGAGGLRAIPDRTVLAAWERVDTVGTPATGGVALETSRTLGAKYAVVGSAVALGSELRLVADVHETESGRRLGRAQVRGAPAQIMALADELTREVLQVLLETSEEGIPSVDLASLTTRSLPALKSYLEAERHYRAGEYDKAYLDYKAATEQDSTFALAYARLGHTADWSGRGPEEASIRRAYRLSERLPLRERRLVWAHYARWAEGRDIEVADSLRMFTDVYPDDAQIWYSLGEALFHGYAPGGWSEAEEAFQQAGRLDPGVAPYHHHLMDVALSFHRDSTLAARRIAAHPEGRIKEIHQLFGSMIFGSREHRKEAMARLDTMPLPDIETPWWVHWPLLHPSDRKLQAQVIETSRDRPDTEPEPYAVRLLINRLERGRIDAATRTLRELEDPADGACILATHLSLGYPIADSLLRPYLEPSHMGDRQIERRHACAGLYLIERGRAEEIGTLLTRARKAQAASKPRSSTSLTTDIDEARRFLEGYQAWDSGDWQRAVNYWPVTIQSHPIRPIWMGDVYRGLGKLRRAGAWYEAAWIHPVAHERMGQLYEEMDRPREAAAAYRRFVMAWADADEPLQARVRMARERLNALRQQKPEQSTTGPS